MKYLSGVFGTGLARAVGPRHISPTTTGATMATIKPIIGEYASDHVPEAGKLSLCILKSLTKY
jgi:hypothetical protein